MNRGRYLFLLMATAAVTLAVLPQVPMSAATATNDETCTSMSACGYDAKSSAVAAVQTFHQQFNDGKFDDIWNEAADEFRVDLLRMAGSKRPYDAWMPHFRESLGRVVSSSTAKWTAKINGSVTTVSLDQDTKFEHSTGVEHFSFLVSDGKAKLRDWSISSPLFAIPGHASNR